MLNNFLVFLAKKRQIKGPRVHFFWGCPALRAGRAVPGSQVCSAHRFFALLKSSVGPSAPLPIPQPLGLRPAGGCAA
ncbi:hypothetical protein SGRA_0513 [Saprospira grandis str. Lewin]|uniref:Uncharacterized protein n=1 Tax=Saprospira grandis (strain Lewin) TaxID=984262 RepID=H6L9S4_SAPGL|nr:hypothetical protein SGRA_0513 [Saprospira grandis str. Lewin]